MAFTSRLIFLQCAWSCFASFAHTAVFYDHILSFNNMEQVRGTLSFLKVQYYRETIEANGHVIV